MPVLLSPFGQETQRSVWDFNAPLGGVEYRYALRYLPRLDRWYLYLATAAGEPLLLGAKIVLRHSLLYRYRDKQTTRWPQGHLVALAVDRSTAEPGFECLGRRVKLFFFADSEIAGPPESPVSITISSL